MLHEVSIQELIQYINENPNEFIIIVNTIESGGENNDSE